LCEPGGEDSGVSSKSGASNAQSNPNGEIAIVMETMRGRSKAPDKAAGRMLQKRIMNLGKNIEANIKGLITYNIYNKIE
jgi:hypothetical protein